MSYPDPPIYKNASAECKSRLAYCGIDIYYNHDRVLYPYQMSVQSDLTIQNHNSRLHDCTVDGVLPVSSTLSASDLHSRDLIDPQLLRCKEHGQPLPTHPHATLVQYNDATTGLSSSHGYLTVQDATPASLQSPVPIALLPPRLESYMLDNEPVGSLAGAIITPDGILVAVPRGTEHQRRHKFQPIYAQTILIDDVPNQIIGGYPTEYTLLGGSEPLSSGGIMRSEYLSRTAALGESLLYDGPPDGAAASQAFATDNTGLHEQQVLKDIGSLSDPIQTRKTLYSSPLGSVQRPYHSAPSTSPYVTAARLAGPGDLSAEIACQKIFSQQISGKLQDHQQQVHKSAQISEGLSMPQQARALGAMEAQPDHGASNDRDGSLIPGEREPTRSFTYASPTPVQYGTRQFRKRCGGTCGKNFETDKAQDPNRTFCNRCWKKEKKDPSRMQAKTYRYDALSVPTYTDAHHFLYPQRPPLDYRSPTNDSDDFEHYANQQSEDEWVERFINAANERYESSNQIPKHLCDHLNLHLADKGGHVLHEHFLMQQKTYHEKPYNDSSEDWYTNDWLNVRMRFLFQAILTVHAGGASLYPLGGDNRGYTTDRSLKCSERLARIEEVLRYDKRTLIDVVEGRGVLGLASNPKQYHARKLSNFRCNTRKKNKLDFMADLEAKGSGEVGGDEQMMLPAPFMAGRGRKRKAGPQAGRMAQRPRRDTTTRSSDITQPIGVSTRTADWVETSFGPGTAPVIPETSEASQMPWQTHDHDSNARATL